MRPLNTDTQIWEQRWFEKMTAGNKLAWFYIKDRCNHAGIWNIDILKLVDHFGTDKFDLNKFLEEINRDYDPITGEVKTRTRVKMVDNKYLWIVDYIGFHWGNKKGVCSVNNPSVFSALKKLDVVGVLEEAIEQGYVVFHDSNEEELEEAEYEEIKDVNSSKEGGTEGLTSPSDGGDKPLSRGLALYKNKSKNKSKSSNRKKKEKKDKNEKSKASLRFQKPSMEECSEWLKEKKGFPPDVADPIAEHFWSFYEARGWMMGKSKMKRWEIALGQALNWDTIQEIINKSFGVDAKGERNTIRRFKNVLEEWDDD